MEALEQSLSCHRPGRSTLLNRGASAAAALLLVAGCATFPLPRYEHIAHQSLERTYALRGSPIESRALNRAAALPCRSQSDIKVRLEPLWNPSSRPAQWINYNGLLATRYSQLDTAPGPAFQHGTLFVHHLGRETSVRYVAAFRPSRRLPLVVAISGINGTVEGKVTLDILQDLYDSGDFHVIHLESLTNVQHELRNRRLFCGGFPEGLLLHESIAELRSRPELASQISQVHLLGVSFGGLLSAIAAHCEDQFRTGVIDGAVLAFSPPLDLRQLFDNIAGFPYIHDRIHQSYLEDGLQKFAEHGYLKLEADPKQIDFDEYMHLVAVPYMTSVYPALKTKFPDMPPLRTADDVYAISSVRPFLNCLGVPFFYVYAYDDPVLSPGYHFRDVLIECSNPLVDGILVPQGGHLGFDSVSSGRYTSRVALEYFRYWSAR
jgi:predicted alpha/beta-fold hydrolase